MDGRSAAAALGVDPQATKDEIRRAFRSGAKLTHPDLVGSDDAFIALRRAFELLLPLAPESAANRTTGPTGVRGVWLSPATERARPTLDRRDRCDGRRRAAHRPPARRTVAAIPRRPERDARGLTFEDHLTAALEGAASPPRSRRPGPR